MGEGELQGNESRGNKRPGELRWPGSADDVHQAQGTPAQSEVDSLYGRSGIQNQQPYTKPPMKFMEGEQNPLVPDTKGRVWEEVDSTGRVRKVHGRPHWQLPAPMATDQSQTMEDNARAAEERARRGNAPAGPTPDDIERKRAENRFNAIQQEKRIREYTDWAPNVVGNDWMGGLGFATAVLLCSRGKNVPETLARMVMGFGYGAAATGAMQFGFNDFGDGFWSKHGGEFKWFTDGVLVPLTYTVAAKSKPIQRLVLGSGKLLSKDTAIGIGLPMALGGLASLVGNGMDKAFKTEDRNPTYATWCQQGGLDSAAVALAGGGAYLLSNRNLLVGGGVGIAAWFAARKANEWSPHPTPANQFDKSLVSLDALQKTRSTEAMEEAVSQLKEFGNFGRTDVLKNPWDLQHPWEIPGNLHDQFVGRTKLRVNNVSTAPELSLLANVYGDSQHCKPGYSGTVAHAAVNFAAGERSLKWGAIGVEKLLGDSVGQDTQVDLGGEALRKFINARREIDQCIDYAQKHDGQIPEGEPDGKPINAAEEVKMLTALGDRVDHAMSEVFGPHEKLDQVIDDVKNRLWTGHVDAVNELRADVKERAKYPKLKHELTPRLQAKLCRDLALMDLAYAELHIESKLKFNSSATGESAKQVAFLTSEMKPIEVYFGETMAALTWARTKMTADDPAQADLKRIADRAYALYQKVKQAGLPETAVMGHHLQDFLDGKLYDIGPDYTSDAANRAAIRNGRNPIADELREYENPPQQTDADRQRDQAAAAETQREQQAADQQASQLGDQNNQMQQAEIDYANRRDAYARSHIQEEIAKFKTTGRVPTAAEIDGIYDSLVDQFDYLVKTGQLKLDAVDPNTSSQAPAQQPTAAAPVQQAQPQYSQPQASQTMLDPRAEMDARVRQFISANGRRPSVAEMRDLAQGLSSTNFKMYNRPGVNPSQPHPQLAPQEPVPVIHQGTPDQQ
ncbi:MAG: hypothetical protein K2Y22_05595 [Candidatus Obscuribacterales bacterium]|nr:hypothetical protein [Candidatus Obscuribacterales bacterium]